jgi:hypothetical protein
VIVHLIKTAALIYLFVIVAPLLLAAVFGRNR